MGEVGGLACDLSLEFRIIPKSPNALGVLQCKIERKTKNGRNKNGNMLELNQGMTSSSCSMFLAPCQRRTRRRGKVDTTSRKKRLSPSATKLRKSTRTGFRSHRFGHQITKFSDITPDKIGSAFVGGPNEMSTDTAGAISAAWAEHKERKNEQTFVLIVTDGAPNDKEAVKRPSSTSRIL